MEKYTIIYGEFFNVGSRHTQIIKHKHIECEPTKLIDTVEHEIGWDFVHFVFDGHCVQTESHKK